MIGRREGGLQHAHRAQSGIVGDNGTGTAPEIATKWIGLRIGGGLAHSLWSFIVINDRNRFLQPMP